MEVKLVPACYLMTFRICLLTSGVMRSYVNSKLLNRIPLTYRHGCCMYTAVAVLFMFHVMFFNNIHSCSSCQSNLWDIKPQLRADTNILMNGGPVCKSKLTEWTWPLTSWRPQNSSSFVLSSFVETDSLFFKQICYFLRKFSQTHELRGQW